MSKPVRCTISCTTATHEAIVFEVDIKPDADVFEQVYPYLNAGEKRRQQRIHAYLDHQDVMKRLSPEARQEAKYAVDVLFGQAVSKALAPEPPTEEEHPDA